VKRLAGFGLRPPSQETYPGNPAVDFCGEQKADNPLVSLALSPLARRGRSMMQLGSLSIGRVDARATPRIESGVTIAPALATIALGLVVLFCVGFLETPAVHNSIHDTRHANGFPCH
jgi:cobalt transporter subunit CbtB